MSDSSYTPIHKLMIANRGEIAERIIRTCKRMGIKTAAVFSEPDRHLPFVDAADEAVYLEGEEAKDSYLNIKKIIDAATLLGADAIHPGYGFLAENAEFAKECKKSGIRFVGPQSEVIDMMGSKVRAKDLAIRSEVPVVPGYQGDDQSSEGLLKHAKQIGFPILLKASAGGGGKGMRRVDAEADFSDALIGAKREAMRSFADDTLLIEKYILAPRHIEVQILGDQHGNRIHIFERECSIQRRHQKIIEESPASGIGDETRTALCDAALRLANAIGYENAGTVEFIMDQEGSFYFLEVNTRLQVEHAVTEMVTRYQGAPIDLVEEQLRIAMGEPLRFSQESLTQQGCAVEARLYAEDARNEFLPQTGTLVDWNWDPAQNLRVDDGQAVGCEVGVHYDPMLAKFIAWGASRHDAIRSLTHSLMSFSAQGVTTNQDFLVSILKHPEYLKANTNTHFIATHQDDLNVNAVSSVRNAALVLTACDVHVRSAQAECLPNIPLGFRNNFFAFQKMQFTVGDQPVEVAYQNISQGIMTDADESAEVIDAYLEGDVLVANVQVNGLRSRYRISRHQQKAFVWSNKGSVALDCVARFPVKVSELPTGACVAPMPGKIVSCHLSDGDVTEEGQVIVVMEAMKMEHSIRAQRDGVVTFHVVVGEQVKADALLVSIAEPDAD